jgi:hypothetical protein
MESSTPTARQSALAFTEGVRAGWLTSDLVAWVEEHLVRTERLVLGHGPLNAVTEHGWGVLPLQSARVSGSKPARCITASQVPQLLDASRHKVVQALRAAIDARETAFVNAALFASRVVRVRAPDGQPRWSVRLVEGCALSDQVLALFAADALEQPSAYETDLAVCDACGAVTLVPTATGSRRGCPAHPFGGAELHRSKTPAPASMGRPGP